MKLAVISDLHGNYYALSEVMEFLRRQQIDGIIGLGDFVTDGPFPQRMMGVLREMQDEFPCYLVRGNREEYLLENLWQPQNWKAGSSTSGLLDYTFRNLTPFFDVKSKKLTSNFSFAKSIPYICILKFFL